jgi:hypothetical protein
MGACGCCEGFGDFRFPGPNGGWYTLQIYTGCIYCDEGPGVNLSYYSLNDPMLPDVLDLPIVEIGELFGVPTVDWNATAKQLKKGWPEDHDVAYVADDELPDAIIHGSHAVAQRWLKAVVYKR